MSTIEPKDIQSEVEDFFHKVGIDLKAAVSKHDGGFLITLETADSGLLIGHHGDTLQDFQTILGLILNNKYHQDEWVRYSLDIGGWRAEREQNIRELTLKAIEKVRSTGEPFTLPPMRAAERRLTHVIIGEHTDVKSESTGTGPERKVTISPAS
jgi:spoIIIJ-associated protein